MIRKVLIAGMILFATAGLARAETVQIESETLFVEHKKNRAEFEGSVYLKRDDFELRCDRLVVFYQQGMGGELERADAYGNVEMRQGDKHGSSQKAIYRQKKGILILIGDAKVIDTKSVIRGEKMTYDINTKKTVVNQGIAGERVHLSIEEEEKNSEEKPAP